MTFVLLMIMMLTTSAFKPLPYKKVNSLTKSFNEMDNIIKMNMNNNRLKIRLHLTPEEDEEYFESEMDRKSFKEKLPIALGVLATVSLPFIVGLIYLYQNK